MVKFGSPSTLTTGITKKFIRLKDIEGRGGSCVPGVLGSNLGTTEAVKIHQGPHRAEPRHHPR